MLFRAVCLAVLFACTAGSSLSGQARLDLLLSSRFEYYDDEDLFGGEYAPFYQFMNLTLKDIARDRVRFHTGVYATRDLEREGQGFTGDAYSFYLELRDMAALPRARFGRFVHTSGFAFQAIDGADVVFKTRGDLELEAYAGRNKIFYDTRYAETPLDLAPYSDEGAVAGGSLRFSPFAKSRLEVGYSIFDPKGDAGRQSWATLAFTGDLGPRARLEMTGRQNVTDDSGSEIGSRLVLTLGRGVTAQLTMDRVRPDRVNPEVVTRIFVSDTVTTWGGGLTVPLSERISLFGRAERCGFDSVWDALDVQGDLFQTGVNVNQWGNRGLEMSFFHRMLSGEPGKLHELSFSGEKRLMEKLSLRWTLEYVKYRRAGEEWANAHVINGRVRLFLHRAFWIDWELEDYGNIDFDYNVRTRFSLNLRLDNVAL